MTIGPLVSTWLGFQITILRPEFDAFWILTETRSFKSRHLVKFSLGIWGLMTTILTNAYTTTIISFLTIPRSKPVPNTYEELAKDSSIKLTIEKDFVMTQVILVTRCTFNNILHSLKMAPMGYRTQLRGHWRLSETIYVTTRIWWPNHRNWQLQTF